MLDAHEFLKQHPPVVDTEAGDIDDIDSGDTIDCGNTDITADNVKAVDMDVAGVNAADVDADADHTVGVALSGGSACAAATSEDVASDPDEGVSEQGRNRHDSAFEQDLDACRESALRLLDAAPRASGALRDRLLSKGYQTDVVDEVIDRLERVDLIDDSAYAQTAVRYCAGRMMGRRGAVMEMIRKGVDRQLAEETARIADEHGVFVDAAWELGRSVASKTSGLSRDVRKRRFWSAGGRKGHNPEMLREISHELFDSESGS